MTISSIRFGHLYELSSSVMAAANRAFDQRGLEAYLEYLYAQTRDEALSPRNLRDYDNNVVLYDLSDDRGLLATNTGRAKSKNRLVAYMQAQRDTGNNADSSPTSLDSTLTAAENYLQQARRKNQVNYIA